MTTQTETLLADLKCTLAASTQGEWQKGATTHHTVTETGYKIAEFHHASDALFCDVAHKLMPEIIGTLETQAKRIAELEQAAQAAQAVIDRWDTPLWKDVPATAEYINELREALK